MQPRFRALDGIRGVAALLIVVLHGQPMLNTRLFEHGYLMVDLFFLMSGFVLSAGYGERLAQPGAGPWFARMRALRLYPLAILGLIAGVVVEAFAVLHGTLAPRPQWIVMIVLGALFLPWLGGGLIVPFDGPAWSLQLELWINILYGALARRLSNRWLIAIVAVFALALAAASLACGQFDGGFANNDPTRHSGPFAFLVGWARVGFSFPLGVLLHRLWREGRLSQVASRLAGPLIPAALVLIAFVPPVPSPVFDLVIVFAVFPALLLLAANHQPSARAARIYGRLGGWSYGLYTLHGPILVALHSLIPQPAAPAGRLALFALALGLSVAAAALAERWIDAPARRWASGRRIAPTLTTSPARV
ncbi:MAG: acyltransferase [Caulobacteraceae bacterium]|nr:acyltransferase [Caulobacteraceae bacterium]